MATLKEISVIARILAEYGLDYTRVLDPQTGYRNRSYAVMLAGGRTANVILYKTEPGILAKIRAANTVSNYLAEHGFPTRQTIDPRIITLRYGGKVKYGAVYNYLPGRTIPWEAYTMKHLKLLGATMGRMHAALREMKPPAGTLPDLNLGSRDLVSRMNAYFARANVQAAMQAKLGVTLRPAIFKAYTKLLLACVNLPNQQPLHMDFVRSNILFEGSAISGVIDFEKTAHGHPVFDIARTLAFLLVDCKYKSEPKIRKYFLKSGYIKRGGQDLVKNNLLEHLVNLYLLHDFYKFLLHNPYDFLEQNEHFVRTKHLLIARGLVKTAVLTA